MHLLFRACAPQLTTVQRGGGCDTLCQTLLHEGDGSVGAQSEAQKLAQETLDEAVPLLDALSQSEYEATTAVLKVQWYTAGPVARLAMVSLLPLHAACTLNCAEAPVQPAELEKCSVVSVHRCWLSRVMGLFAGYGL